MLLAISELPPATSDTERLISLVVAVCSSTALAIVFWISWIRLTMVPIFPIAVTALRVSF